MHNVNQYEISFGPIEPWIAFEMKKDENKNQGNWTRNRSKPHMNTHTHVPVSLFVTGSVEHLRDDEEEARRKGEFTQRERGIIR